MTPKPPALDLDVALLLEGDRWAYAQAEHLTELAGLFGEGSVLVTPPEAASARGDDQG